MTLKIRRYLFIIFILAFIIVAPLVCLYTAGYQLGKNFSIQKTGILVVKTNPDNANINLNNITQKNVVTDLITGDNNTYTSPAKIKNLLPGNYEVKLSKDGYWSWNKKLSIASGQSIYLENAYLFKNNLPTLLSAGQYSSILPSPSGQYLLAIKPNSADTIDLNQETNNSLSVPTSTPAAVLDSNNCQWSPDSAKVILGPYLYDLSTSGLPLDLRKTIGNNYTKLAWNQSDASQIYYVSKNELYNLNISSNIVTPLFATSSMGSFLAKGDNLFFTSHEHDSAILNIFSISNKKITEQINLPSSNYIFINPDSRYLNLLDQTHEILYLIDPAAEIKPVVEIINDVNNAHWLDDHRLIFANDFEIWWLDINNYNKFIITRISTGITDIWPFTNEYYGFYSTEQTINVIDFDYRNKDNILKLINLNQIKNPHLGKNADAFYFISKIGDQNGVYKLSLQ